MKAFLVAILAVAGLSGCAVVPAEPGVYAAAPPAPVVVIRPQAGYYGGYYGGHSGRGYYGHRRHWD